MGNDPRGAADRRRSGGGKQRKSSMIMRPRRRTRIKAAASALAVVGVLLWVIAATLHVGAAEARDVAVDHIGGRSLGIVAGGVAIAGSIALLAAGS